MKKRINFLQAPFEIGGQWYIEGTDELERPMIALNLPLPYVPLFSIARRTESSLKRNMRSELHGLSHLLIPTMLDPVLISYDFLAEKALCELQLREKRVMNCEPWFAVLFSMVWNKPMLCAEKILLQQEVARNDLRNYQTNTLMLGLRLLETNSPEGSKQEGRIYRELGRRRQLLECITQLGKR